MTEVLRAEATPVTAAPADVPTVPCVYCREPIAADAFTRWSTRRLRSADCPTCLRRVTLAETTWRRWSRELGASELAT